MPISTPIGISPTSAKGDILSSNGSSRTRVPAGSNGQILIARSSATSGIELGTASTAGAGVFELISSNTLTTSTATVTFSSIPTTYKYLKVYARLSDTTTGGVAPLIRLNTSTTASYYDQVRYRVTATPANYFSSTSGSSYLSYSGNTGEGMIFEVDIDCSQGTSKSPCFFYRTYSVSTANAAVRWSVGGTLASIGTSAVSQISFLNISTDTYGANSVFLLYGRKV